MKITLTVTQVAGTTPSQPLSVTFDEQGGTIGRRDENDWVLPDPERFISGRHAQVDFSEGAFHLTDVSSNGVFVNHTAQPLGMDNRVALQDGDIISIGDYDISVSLQKPASPTLESNGFEGLDDPFAHMVDESAGQELRSSLNLLLKCRNPNLSSKSISRSKSHKRLVWRRMKPPSISSNPVNPPKRITRQI
ncbi:MAG: type VI secretion system-associated FHA domain protein TagH [Candidatus Thiodiazotropha sp.]|nr:type VI secretion system-associated FHA domain protein TagH [Candidatus Thiodiazotropha sp.]MCM8920906.1 type VI secretion system-associated FHA domain protein TagH [Candidatus Thiodiazotropha sp.]